MVFSLCRLALLFIDNLSQFFYSLFNVPEGHVTVFNKFFSISLPACHFYHKAGCWLLWKVSSVHVCVMEYQSTENHGLSVMESIMENTYIPKSLNFYTYSYLEKECLRKKKSLTPDEEQRKKELANIR